MTSKDRPYRALTEDELSVIRELENPVFSATYLEEWINCHDSVDVNVVTALIAMGAKGYYTAVQDMVKAKEKRRGGWFPQ